MSHTHPPTCAQMDALLSRLDLGELDAEEQRQVEAHLGGCPSCRETRAQYARLSEATAALLTPPLGAERADAIFARIAQRRQPLAEAEALPEILTMDEVATLLRVSLDELEAELEHLPVFEFAGQLRMRRSQLFRWIEAREKRAHLRLMAADAGR
ncbi:MAG: hypothetical protein CMH57_10970 [Myxococcales bacterium]|nr:hypothetical protein [Myxococcales bacterium]